MLQFVQTRRGQLSVFAIIGALTGSYVWRSGDAPHATTNEPMPTTPVTVTTTPNRPATPAFTPPGADIPLLPPAEQSPSSRDNGLLANKSRLDPALRADLGRQQLLHGVAIPWREANLGADVARIVAIVHVKEGDVVAAGQPLIDFDRSETSQQLNVAAAAERGAAAAVRQAELELSLARYRQEQLESAFQAGASTAAERQEATIRWQQSQAALDVARHAADQASAQLQLAKVEDQRRTLRAPFSGVVMRIDAVAGEIVEQPSSLIQLADLGRLRTELQLPASSMSQLRLQAPWLLRAGAPLNADVQARLIAVEPRVNPVTQTIRAVFEIPNEAGHPAGFSVRLPAGANAGPENDDSAP
ncbi:MAG: efflux RND transporter periplasmic adaptor subunit [Planctomycetales bacterium]|nr:efflux RND transporter periplasmic adaptor subunit [Planctomycetales bacterium]